MTFILGLLLIPWVFWALIILLTFGAILSVEDKEGFSILTAFFIIGGLLLFWAAGSLPSIDYTDALKIAAAYLPVGFVYSIFRYKLFCHKIVNTFISSNFKDRDGLERRLKVSENKGRIANWMLYWPVSIISYFVCDMLRDIFDAIWSYIKNVYSYIAEGELKRYDDNKKSN